MKKGFLLLLLLVGISLACNFGKPLPPTPTPTLAPLMADVLQPTDPPPSLTPTITPTSTPLPTPTPLPGMRIHTGDQAIFNGDWDTAISAFQAALDSSSDPEIQSAALVGLGRVLYQTGDYPLALDHLRAVVENYPASPHRAEAFFFLGQTFSALARYSEAADAFLNYLLLRPGVIDAYIYERRGDALFNANDFGGALGDYQAALKSPRLEVNFTLEIKMARCYAFLGDYNTALVMYADIYNRSGSAAIKAEVNLLKGQTLAVMGQPDQAYLAYLDSVFNYPTQYNSYLALVELVNAG